MGFNTVAVIYNDLIGCASRDFKRMDDAIRQFNMRGHIPHINYFGFGKVVSMAHADSEQVVIVSGNDGTTASNASDLGASALLQMKECLERHGYTVKKRRNSRQPPKNSPARQTPADTPSHSQNPPGKIALRLLEQMHQGPILRVSHGHPLPGNQTEDRVGFAMPLTSEANGSVILDDVEDCALVKHYATHFVFELSSAGLIETLYDFSPYVSCLTPKGFQVAVELFGAPSQPLLVCRNGKELTFETAPE